MSKKTKILIIVLVSLIILSIWAFITASNITHDVKQAANDPENNDEKARVEELIIIETKEGKKFWEVYAKSGQYDDFRSSARLIDVKGNFYKDDKVVISFDAPTATYVAKNNEVKLSDGSRAATDNDILITSDELSWKGKQDGITATGNVKIKRNEELLITTDKAGFNTDLTNLKLSGNSQTRVYK